MARKNNIDMIAKLIESEIEMGKEQTLEAAKRYDYNEALKWQKYTDGLIRSLLFCSACKPKGKNETIQ